MKAKNLIFPLIAILSGTLVSGCNNPENNQGQTDTAAVLKGIKVSADAKLSYNYNEEFVKPSVTASYEDNSTKEVGTLCSFEGYNKQTPGIQEITVTYSENGKTAYDYYNVVVAQKVIHVVSLTVLDAKLTYEYGEDFVKPSVTANFDDGSTLDVSNNATFSEFNSKQVGAQTITVSYKYLNNNPVSTSYTVNVTAPSFALESISIGQDVKTVYSYNSSFEKPTVTAHFSDGSSQDVTDEATFTGFDSSVIGNQLITVSYTFLSVTKTQSYTVTINEIQSKLKFALFADIQLTGETAISGQSVLNAGTTANAPLALKNHLEFIKNQSITTVVMNGDITNQANNYYYEYFNKIVASVYGNDKTQWPEFIWNMGNHEWWYGVEETEIVDEQHDAVAMFKNYARIESDNLVKQSNVSHGGLSSTLPSYYKVVNGIPFMVVSGIDATGEISTELLSELTEWLNEIKQLESVKAGGPIFIEYHYPISTSMTHGQGSTYRTETLENLLRDTPNAVVFTGDTHFPGINERSINQVDFTTINIGSSSYSRNVNESAVICKDYYNVGGSGSGKQADKMMGNVKFNEAYTPTIQILDVKDDYSYTIDRYFSKENGEADIAGKQWTINPIKSKEDFTYTNDRFQKKASAQALYGKDGLNWNQDDEVIFGVNEKEHQMTVRFPEVIDYHCCEHYRITVNGKVYDEVSNYYKNLQIPEENYFILDDVPTATTYNVEVVAYDFYDNPSTNKLTSSTNTATTTVDSIDKAMTDTYSDIQTRNRFDDVSANSQSSIEYYYKGVQTYQAGAICGRLIYKAGENGFTPNNYITFDDNENDIPLLTMDVKVEKGDEASVGFSYVTYKNEQKEEEWKTDFGVEYQKKVPADGQWHTITWNLKSLFGTTKLSEIANITLKCKSASASTSGYEMGILVDNLDIIQGEEEMIYRGKPFVAGSDFIKDLSEAIPLTDKLTIDVLFDNSTNEIGLMLGDRWNDYFGYFYLKQSSQTGDYQGITVASLSDGYTRFIIDFSQGIKVGQGNPTKCDLVYIAGRYTTATGYVDINPTADVEIVRGNKFETGDELRMDFSTSASLSSKIHLDIKFEDETKSINCVLAEDWENYFGYFELSGTTTTGAYNGLTVTLLEDGYYRFTFDLAQVTKKVLNPTAVNFIYFKPEDTKTGGYTEYMVEKAQHRGLEIIGGTNCVSDLKKNYDVSTETIEFDILFDDEETTKFSICFGQGWSIYFGYYDLTKATQTGDVEGCTVTVLQDGYHKFVFNLSELTKCENGEGTVAPTYINLVYIRGEWSTGNGYFDLITK